MGTRFLAVDPGLRGCGVALFEDRSLQWAAYVENIMRDGRGPPRHGAMARRVHNVVSSQFGFVKHLVIEFPRIYPKGPKDKRSDPNDLLDVAGVAGALAAIYEEVEWVLPQEWKGQVPKDVMNARVMKRLGVIEGGNIVSIGAKDHNTIDAVGIGLHHLGRL